MGEAFQRLRFTDKTQKEFRPPSTVQCTQTLQGDAACGSTSKQSCMCRTIPPRGMSLHNHIHWYTGLCSSSIHPRVQCPMLAQDEGWRLQERDGMP